MTCDDAYFQLIDKAYLLIPELENIFQKCSSASLSKYASEENYHRIVHESPLSKLVEDYTSNTPSTNILYFV